MKKVFYYFYFVVTIGVVLGSVMLTLVLRSVVNFIRYSGWLAAYENSIVIAFFLGFLLCVLVIARWLTKWFVSSYSTVPKKVFIVFITVSFFISLAGWFLFTATARKNIEVVSQDGRFVTGTYPDAAKMRQLKEQGYSGIVSLLDPLVLPDEFFLIQKEKVAAQQARITLINIPMLPAKNKNPEAVKKIAALVMQNTNAKYYVHGNYGGDRIEQFIREANYYRHEKALSQVKSFSIERGKVIHIDQHLIVGPKPTEEEIQNIIIGSPNNFIGIAVVNIVSFYPDEAKNNLAPTEMQMLNENGVHFFAMPITQYPYDPERVLDIAKKIHALSGGVFAYSYYMPPQSVAMEGFILSYLTDLPALPRQLFWNQPMQNGEVTIIAPNIAIGPNPTQDEFKEYLQARGIRAIAYIGSCDDKTFLADQNIAKSMLFQSVCFHANDPRLFQTLANNGPWYVYGTELPIVQQKLKNYFGHLIPDSAMLGE